MAAGVAVCLALRNTHAVNHAGGCGRSLAGNDVEVYSDYRELRRHAPVDAVVIASPNCTPYDVLRDVFRTHKHILVEKSLCTAVMHCAEIVDRRL